jgi:hypothetical protein
VIDADKAGDRREILHRIVGEIRIERRIDDEGRFRTDEQSVAVARLVRDIFGGDLIIGARLVFHDRLRAPIGIKAPRQHAGQEVGDAARRRRRDDGDGFRRIIAGAHRRGRGGGDYSDDEDRGGKP